MRIFGNFLYRHDQYLLLVQSIKKKISKITKGTPYGADGNIYGDICLHNLNPHTL